MYSQNTFIGILRALCEFESNSFWGLVIVKNKLMSVFYASVLLLMIDPVITLSKFTAEPSLTLSVTCVQ